jgi:putative intracellular protease/amidase
MRLSILLFDGFTALDIVGGYEVLSRLPGVETDFVASVPGLVAADTRRLGLVAWCDFRAAASPDILYVPGGPGVLPAMKDQALIDFIRASHATSTWTVGICNGVELLGAAGLIEGKEVTTNYFSRDRIAGYGGKLVKTRYHRDGKLVTGAGVSASIDAGIFMAREIAGEAAARTLQLGVEYYPDSPFADTRTPDHAPEAAKAMVKAFGANSERFLASRTAPFSPG